LILFHCIWFQGLLLSNLWMMHSGMNLLNIGRTPKGWYVFSMRPTS
jgi:hypothetical protein